MINNNGLIVIEGMKFHDIEGGFGEGKKAMLVKDIANIHGREVKKVNELINNNRKRFKDDVDIIDLKTSLSKGLVLEMGFTNAQYGNANNIYLLSERGYAKLLKILEDDVAWEQYEKLVDGYFNMRERKPMSAMELMELQFKVLKDQEEKIVQVENKVDKLEEDMPLFQVDCKELQSLVRKKGTEALGGYRSLAYNDNSLRGKVYSDIQHQIRREFGVTRYEAIKRSQLEKAKEIVNRYRVPLVLEDEIILLNNQIQLIN